MASEKRIYFARQTWIVSAVLLDMFGHGLLFSFPSVLLPGLKAKGSTIKTDLETMSWLASIAAPAAFPGFLVSAFAMELWGRKVTQLLIVPPMTAGWFLIYFATDVPTLMVGRILGGFSAGASIILGSIVIGEYTSPQLRGVFLLLKTAAVYVGNTFVHIIGHYYSWRIVAIIGIITHLIVFCIICTCPESPTWLAVKCKYAQSENAWMWLRGSGAESRTEFERMIIAQKQRISQVNDKPSVIGHLVNFLRKFTKKDFLKPLLIILFSTMVKEACGRHIFPAYALQIVDNITKDKTKSFYYILGIDLIMTFSVAFSSVLAGLLRRRALLFVTGGASLGILMAICIYLYLTSIKLVSKDRNWLPISMFMLYFLLCNLGCTVVPYALLGEVFPVAHKGAGSAISGLIMSTYLMIILKITPALLVSVEIYGTFAIFAVTMGLGLVVLYFILPETKNKTLQEIENYFNHGQYVINEKVSADEEETKMLKELTNFSSKPTKALEKHEYDESSQFACNIIK